MRVKSLKPRNRRKNYPQYPSIEFHDLRQMTEMAAERYGDKPAISFKKKPTDKDIQSMSYMECRDFCRDLGSAFIARGMRDKTVAIIGEASPMWMLTYYSLMSMGAVTVPIDCNLPVADMASILNTAKCEFMVYSPFIDKKYDELRAAVPTLSTCIATAENSAGNPTVEQLRAEGAPLFASGESDYLTYDLDPNRLATIVFTSGTTGKGKGVMLTSENICCNIYLGMYNFEITDKTVAVLPPHHTFCSTIVYVGHYVLGCEIFVSAGIKYVVKELQDVRPTHLVLVPLFVDTFYKRIMSTAEKTGKLKALRTLIKISNGLRKIGIDLRRVLFKSVTKNFGGELQWIICGGAALHQDIIDFFESIGIIIMNGYGITECSPLISCNRNEYRKQGSVGLPNVGGHVQILDPDEKGEGEIAYRGPNVMLGYFENEEATREVFTEDGYFRTGDYGRVEMEGDDQWVYITGRKKNLIIFKNGKNVYPEEIETDIQGVYGVSEVVVYAGESKSDPSREVIVAEIYPDTDALAMRSITDAQSYFEAEIKKINQKNVAFKFVGKVKLRDTEFPKNTSRKITRFAIDKTID